MTRKIATFAAAFLLALSMVAASMDAAEAARLGGGRSFGSRPSYSAPAPKPAPSYNKSQPSNPSQQQNVAQPAQRPGGRFGGFMGGLLAGSLLGALFFGMPFAGGGMMDILLIGLLIFAGIMVFRMIARRRQPEYQYAGADHRHTQAPTAQGGWSGSQWDRLRSEPSGQASGASSAQSGAAVSVPGFDEEEFLRGAKLVYTRLQASWDARDLDDIREFATPEVMEEIKRQAAQDPTPSKTEILLINAKVLEAKFQGQHTVATVYYDVLMREDKTKDAPEQVREVWHFRRESADPKASWKLEGIQQLEN